MTDEMLAESGYDAAFQRGEQFQAAVQLPQDKLGIPYVIIPQGMKVESLEKYQTRPVRTKANAVSPDLASFAAYVNRYKSETSVLFADRGSLSIKAILDYHSAAQPSNCEHTATLQLKASEEWTVWKGSDKRFMSQTEFAEFLEERSLDIVEPDAATLLEAVQDLKVSKDVAWERATNLRNGQVQFKYIEEMRERGDIKLPETLMLQLRPFDRGSPVQVLARLRYRLDEQKLRLQFILERPDLAIEQAFAAAVDQAEQSTELLTLFGSVTTQR